MITVIAGVNGAGKSSVLASYLENMGGDYFNPDVYTRTLMQKNPGLSEDEANAQAWAEGFDMLNQAIDNDDDYAFETTLGGNSVSQALHRAIDLNREVRILFCGLNSPELHIERVAARVARGGHDIPEERIRSRWVGSISNMLTLIPRCQGIVVYDNSQPLTNGKPQPQRLFVMLDQNFTQLPIKDLPQWAKPLAAKAIKTVYPDL